MYLVNMFCLLRNILHHFDMTKYCMSCYFICRRLNVISIDFKLEILYFYFTCTIQLLLPYCLCVREFHSLKKYLNSRIEQSLVVWGNYWGHRRDMYGPIKATKRTTLHLNVIRTDRLSPRTYICKFQLVFPFKFRRQFLFFYAQVVANLALSRQKLHLCSKIASRPNNIWIKTAKYINTKCLLK